MTQTKSTIWRPAQIAELEAAITLEADRSESPLKFHLESINVRTGDSAEDLLKSLIHSIFALRCHGISGGLTANQVETLKETCTELLNISGASRFRHAAPELLSHYYDALSLIELRAGNLWGSWWYLGLTFQTSQARQRRSMSERLLQLADSALRSGDMNLASEALNACRTSGGSDDSIAPRLSVRTVQMLRLEGKLEEAQVAMRSSLSESNESQQRELAWESIVINATATQDLAPMMRFVNQKSSGAQSTLEASLWAGAIKSRKWLESPLRTATIRSKYRDEFRNNDGLKRLAQAVQVIESFSDSSIPLERRCIDIGDMLSKRHRLATVEHELLVLAASARALLRFGQRLLAAQVISQYRSLCLKLTAGRQNDCLQVAGDMLERNWMQERSATESLSQGQPVSGMEVIQKMELQHAG